MLRGWFQNDLLSKRAELDTMPIGQTDLVRLKRGHLGGQFWSAYVPWQASLPHLLSELSKLRAPV